MRILSLASGSKGNCYYVESGESHILVDCGLSLKRLEERMAEAGIDPSKVGYVLISHEHSDHTKGLVNFFKKYHPKIFCNYISAERIEKLNPELESRINTFDNEQLFLGNVTVDAIPVSHDSSFCTAFKLSAGSAAASIVTDLGFIDSGIIDKISGSKVVFLESNHDERMLRICHYPSIIKSRIASNMGHLSNTQAGHAMVELVRRGTRHFALSHISENSDTYEKAYVTIANILGESGINIDTDVVVRFAHQHKIGNNFKLGEDD